jgi:phage gpG-like protein
MAQLVDLAQWLEALPGQLMPERNDLQEVAEAQRDRIKRRTAMGISVDLQVFPPYAPATKKDPPVNLSKTGAMLDGIAVASTEAEAHIWFADGAAAEKAGYHNRGTNRIPQRYFFGVSLADREAISAAMRKALFRRLNK